MWNYANLIQAERSLFLMLSGVIQSVAKNLYVNAKDPSTSLGMTEPDGITFCLMLLSRYRNSLLPISSHSGRSRAPFPQDSALSGSHNSTYMSKSHRPLCSPSLLLMSKSHRPFYSWLRSSFASTSLTWDGSPLPFKAPMAFPIKKQKAFCFPER